MDRRLLALGLAFAGTAAEAQDRPNIVLFLVDDMGVMDTSVPFLTDGKGNPVRYPLNDWYRTPSMERLASQGVRFSQFYAQGVSSPSRASLLTGQDAARHRVTNWIRSEGHNRDDYGPYDWNWEGLRGSETLSPASCRKPATGPSTWGRGISPRSDIRARTRGTSGSTSTSPARPSANPAHHDE